MYLILRPLDFTTLEDFEYMTKWCKDKEIHYLFTVDFHEGLISMMTPEELRAAKRQQKSNKTFMIMADEQIIGEASIDTEFDMLVGRKEGTAWISICIGEKEFRGKGIGYGVMERLEVICMEMGLDRIELGVFAYNKRAIHFYEQLGYRRFHTVKDFTWYNEAWHDDYRMEKYIDMEIKKPSNPS